METSARSSLSPERQVFQAEARQWLTDHPGTKGMSVITSLPDLSEMSNTSISSWKQWFVATARQIIGWIPEDGVAIFYQSDIRINGFLINKAFLIMLAAEEANSSLLWHKIVCRKPPGTVAMGRPSYSHMLCVSRGLAPKNEFLGADVLATAGEMIWSRAMGLSACEVACRYLRDATSTSTVVDPFCGKGSALAVANKLGFDAIGVDLSRSRCRSARNLVLDLDANRN